MFYSLDVLLLSDRQLVIRWHKHFTANVLAKILSGSRSFYLPLK